MNFYAHGYRFRDRPWFLAGTAVPDWLGIADRRLRLRPAAVSPYVDESGTRRAELAAGVMRHLDDDRWFHGSAAFAETSALLAQHFREVVGSGNGHRPGFLGHITTELLIDRVLIDEDPAGLDDYYRALGELGSAAITSEVSGIGPRPSDRLAVFIERFLATEFLRDYGQPGRLRFRLNQVLGRVRLAPLPPEVESVFSAGEEIVRRKLAALLPPA